ncbi:putative undecaprenyl-phosphate N-acetylgalactosaminyl 1-phosphate transferase [compost metagenome]
MGKRVFDILFSIIGLLVIGWLVVLFFILASIDTRQNGLFVQERIGQYGRKFRIYKLRTIQWNSKGEPIVSTFGNFLRSSKIDEFPQLYNVLINDMSFVGPRPDIAGYYDQLKGTDRILLELKPGITCPASLVYRHEEKLLSLQADPVKYNDEVIFPDKVRINLIYHANRSLSLDLQILFRTIFCTIGL